MGSVFSPGTGETKCLHHVDPSLECLHWTDNYHHIRAGFSARGRGRPAHLALVRLRAGDIERNPGPTRRGDANNPARAAGRGGRRRRRGPKRPAGGRSAGRS